MLRYYYSTGSFALGCHIALEEAGAEYEAVNIDIPGGQQRSPGYLAINPQGRVPALVTDHGVLTENVAILAFVAQSFPQARLAPLEDPFAFAEVQAFTSYLATTVHIAHAHRARGHRWAEDPLALAEMRRKAPEVIADCYRLIEAKLLRGPWVMGESYTICDPYLFVMADWLDRHAVGSHRFPRVQEHYERMLERPAVRRAIAAEGHQPRR